MKDTTQCQVDMGDVDGLSKTQNNRAGEFGTGSLVLASSKHNVVIVKPNVEIFDTATAARM